MARSILVVSVCTTLALLFALTRAAVVEQTFRVGNYTVRRLCEERVVVAVNGRIPGPTIEAREGDTVIVHVVNESPYNMTIHWHGVFQLLSAWADGPNYVTQCPIRPGNSYTYRFNITGQEGTLWYHAHVSFLRATVYGALIIRPKTGSSLGYPFPKPYQEIPIVFGEWWNANVVDVEEAAFAVGGAPNVSDAFTINGHPGHLYPCSEKQIFTVNVTHGKTYLLRIINAALNDQLFFKIAGHNLTVVGADAVYTKPYCTDFVVIAPGQTIDALLAADAPPGRGQYYYMAAHAYDSINLPNVLFDNTTTTGILAYTPAATIHPPPTPPIMMPVLPEFNDTPAAHRFYTALTALPLPSAPNVPLTVDERMFVTFGLGLFPCSKANGAVLQCVGPFGEELVASMNNISFVFPTRRSMLEAFSDNDTDGIYTRDFPDRPPVEFNYTSANVSLNVGLLQTVKGTAVKQLRYNATVEVVLQNTALIAPENHPLHLHGFNFFVLAQGFGNYDPVEAEKELNLVDPVVRNTIAVPVGGWAVIRFVANNPGVWIMHCHLDLHLPIGLGMAFEVENGPTPSSTLPPPPKDLPRC